MRDMKARRRSSERRQEQRQKPSEGWGGHSQSKDEVKALLGALSKRWRPLVLTATFCGLRASEIRWLRWSDVDLETREMRVHQRADRLNDISCPKSLSGERTVLAPPMVIQALKEWKLAYSRPITWPARGRRRTPSAGNVPQSPL